ncbi:hypothetical protein [Acinetobacter baumannii]|uniref:hypothetical protein n=1 Tax=Acinetobacter baumannii TaxID=470 RepID=UPI001D1836ED|nr:hypothetical protein [Acinetobacter baumannii]
MTLQAADYYENLLTTKIMKRPPSGGNSFFTGRKTGMRRASTILKGSAKSRQTVGATLGDLDQTLTASISGFGDLMPDEFERVIEGQYPDVKPTVNYRIYSSDNLNSPMFYLLGLQLSSVAMNHKAVTFKAESPRLNTTKTGDIFALDRFSGLKGAI